MPQPTVPKNQLGQTGLYVSRMGLGLAALGRPGYINLGHKQDIGGNYEVAAMEANTHQVLDAAWKSGIQYFDAARSYGRAEEFLGSWITKKNFSPEDHVVGSKWGYTYTACWQVKAEKHEVKEHSLEVLSRQFRESKTHLGDYLKLYQIHSATLESRVLNNKDVLGELAKKKSEGLKIGLSLSGPAQGETLRQALAVRIDGALLFDCVQATWNLLERSAESILQEAHDAGLGIIIKEALANGRLTDRNEDPDFAPSKQILQTSAENLEVTIDALALAAVTRRPWVHVVLSGAAAPEHLGDNLRCFEVDWTNRLEEDLATLQEEAEDYWRKRSALTWN